MTYAPPEVKLVGNMHELLSRVCAPPVDDGVTTFVLQMERGGYTITVSPVRGRIAPYSVSVVGPDGREAIHYVGCATVTRAFETWFRVMAEARVVVPDRQALQDFATAYDAWGPR